MIIVISNRNVQSQYNDERIFGNSTSDEGLKLAEFHYLVQQIDDEFDWDVTDDFDDGNQRKPGSQQSIAVVRNTNYLKSLLTAFLKGEMVPAVPG